MGVWANDILAADGRGDYQDWLRAGGSADEAAKWVRREFAEPLKDVDDKRIVWIALAAAQLEAGNVVDQIRDQALKAIAWCEGSGRDSDQNPFDATSLDGLRHKLGGHPSKSTATSNSRKSNSNSEPLGGDVLAVTLPGKGGEAVIYVAGLSPRGDGSSRIILLLDLAPDEVTADSIQNALAAWRRRRQAWSNGLGRSIACYDASGKLPLRKTRLLLRDVKPPSESAGFLKGLGAIHRSADIPWVVENDVGDWKTHQWTIDPDADA
jgi:hypothetical protein